MVNLKIGNVELKVTKTEVRFAMDAQDFMKHKDGGKEYAQKHIDIIIRSAPNDAAAIRRKAIARALGLSDVVTFE
jgi:hypothetical protein